MIYHKDACLKQQTICVPCGKNLPTFFTHKKNRPVGTGRLRSLLRSVTSLPGTAAAR
jgi:hypothetical protein